MIQATLHFQHTKLPYTTHRSVRVQRSAVYVHKQMEKNGGNQTPTALFSIERWWLYISHSLSIHTLWRYAYEKHWMYERERVCVSPMFYSFWLTQNAMKFFSACNEPIETDDEAKKDRQFFHKNKPNEIGNVEVHKWEKMSKNDFFRIKRGKNCLKHNWIGGIWYGSDAIWKFHNSRKNWKIRKNRQKCPLDCLETENNYANVLFMKSEFAITKNT